MRKLTSILALAAIIFAGAFFTSCNTEDTDGPVITILGDNPMTISLNSTWTDPGATAEDDEDGDLTTSIVVTDPVDKDLAGTYEVVYSCTDAAGNVTTAKREVFVVNDAAAWSGSYSVLDSLNSGATYTYTDIITPSSTQNNRLLVTEFAGYNNGSVYFDVNGTNVILPSQLVNCGSPAADRTFVGNGTFVGNNVIRINYTETTNGTGVSGVEVYTKQ